jgi:NAD(P)-dependent dehydrogenase (short-subunit alcohol dehydrogenase family)
MAEISFEDRVACVTGAGRGIGRAHALLLASRGAAVVVNDLGAGLYGHGSDSDPATAVASEINQAGGRAVASFDDIGTESGAAATIALALEKWGRLDVLIHNAGIVERTAFADADLDAVRRLLSVNLVSAWYLGQPAWRAMLDGGYGRIVFTASNTIFGYPYKSSYAASKAGLLALARCMNQEAIEAGVDIRVNTILPMAQTRTSRPDSADRWGGLNDPSEVAPIMAYLASKRCQFGGEAFAAGATHVGRVLLAQERGWARGEPGTTPEDIETALTALADHEISLPADTLEHINLIFEWVTGTKEPLPRTFPPRKVEAP